MAGVGKRVGEEGKSQWGRWPAVPGACQAWSRPSDGDRCTMDSECPILLPAGHVLIVGSHSFPVATHTSLSVDAAATLHQTLPPRDPAGTAYQAWRTRPVCWSRSTNPPRITGPSPSGAM